MNGKIGSYGKFCAQNKFLASKMRNLKQQRIAVFAPLTLKRWIIRDFLKITYCFGNCLNRHETLIRFNNDRTSKEGEQKYYLHEHKGSLKCQR